MAQLSLNLKPLCDNASKIIETYGSEDTIEEFWSVWLEKFKEMNVKAGATKQDLPTNTKKDVDFANFRNQLLNVLVLCPNLRKLAEKNNAEICHQFLEVFQKCETKTKKGDGLLAFLKMFAKFSNLRSMSAFEKVKFLAQDGLGHQQDKIRETAVSFFTAAYKELRPHKVS